jgi:predicted adenylyl cyclase CyaB
MSHLNVEIKARCGRPDRVRAALRKAGADFRGTDRQIDTYFRCPSGRLKLRQGNIETALIHYDRPDRTGPKKAVISLCRCSPQEAAALKPVLARALGVLAVVDKRRRIYFIGNVKFHIDRVRGLGSFVEIEAIDEKGTLGAARLGRQCRQYMRLLGVRREDLVECSYSDMVLERGNRLAFGRALRR